MGKHRSSFILKKLTDNFIKIVNFIHFGRHHSKYRFKKFFKVTPLRCSFQSLCVCGGLGGKNRTSPHFENLTKTILQIALNQGEGGRVFKTNMYQDIQKSNVYYEMRNALRMGIFSEFVCLWGFGR